MRLRVAGKLVLLSVSLSLAMRIVLEVAIDVRAPILVILVPVVVICGKVGKRS